MADGEVDALNGLNIPLIIVTNGVDDVGSDLEIVFIRMTMGVEVASKTSAKVGIFDNNAVGIVLTTRDKENKLAVANPANGTLLPIRGLPVIFKIPASGVILAASV